jgi:hypothetical protein
VEKLKTFYMSVQTKSIEGAGIGKFNFTIYTPDGATGNLPAFIFSPGEGQFGTDATKLDDIGPLKYITGTAGWKPNFIVVAVQNPQAWPPAPTDQPWFMRAVLKELLNGTYKIDPNQFYLMGFSYGATIMLHYMQQETDANYHQPAAVIAVSMGIQPLSAGKLSGNDLRFAKTALIAFCGASDSSVFRDPISNYVSLCQAARYANASITITAGGHDATYWDTIFNPASKLAPYNAALALTTPAPVVTPPPPVTVPMPKTLKSVLTTYTYSDGTTETITKP